MLEKLVPACADLNKNISIVRNILERELGWLILPEEYRSFGKDAVIGSICDVDLAVDEPSPMYYGLAHIPQCFVKDIDALNEAKENFKSAVLDIRNKQRKRERNIALARLITGDDRRYCRDPAVQDALKKVGFASLDLAACYKQVRVLPSSIEMIGWTWQAKRREVFRMTKSEVDKYARRWLSGDSLEITLKQVAALSDAEDYARVRTQAIPQLKANYLDEASGERVMISATNVFLTTRQGMPKSVFNPRPDGIDDDRKVRRDRIIHEEPIIKALNLHRYLTDEERSELNPRG